MFRLAVGDTRISEWDRNKASWRLPREVLKCSFLQKCFILFSVGIQGGEMKQLIGSAGSEPWQLYRGGFVCAAGEPLKEWVVYPISVSESAAALIGNQ